MRTAALMMAGLIAVSWMNPAEAQRRDRERFYGPYDPYELRQDFPREYRSYRRSSTITPNGLCQRDTGIPTGQLDFRNPCDIEEFWNRQNRGNIR